MRPPTWQQKQNSTLALKPVAAKSQQMSISLPSWNFGNFFIFVVSGQEKHAASIGTILFFFLLFFFEDTRKTQNIQPIKNCAQWHFDVMTQQGTMVKMIRDPLCPVKSGISMEGEPNTDSNSLIHKTCQKTA